MLKRFRQNCLICNDNFFIKVPDGNVQPRSGVCKIAIRNDNFLGVPSFQSSLTLVSTPGTIGLDLPLYLIADQWQYEVDPIVFDKIEVVSSFPLIP